MREHDKARIHDMKQKRKQNPIQNFVLHNNECWTNELREVDKRTEAEPHTCDSSEKKSKKYRGSRNGNVREYDKATMHYTNSKSLIRTRTNERKLGRRRYSKKKVCLIPNLHPRKRIPSLWSCRFRCRRHRRCRRRRCG